MKARRSRSRRQDHKTRRAAPARAREPNPRARLNSSLIPAGIGRIVFIVECYPVACRSSGAQRGQAKSMLTYSMLQSYTARAKRRLSKPTFSFAETGRTVELARKSSNPLHRSAEPYFETHLSAQQARAQAPARFPRPHGDDRRPQGRRGAAGPRQEAPVGLSACGDASARPADPALRISRGRQRLTRQCAGLLAASSDPCQSW